MLTKRGAYAIGNNEMLRVALSHVFNLITVSLTVAYVKAELVCHIWRMALTWEGTFSSKYANYKNVFVAPRLLIPLVHGTF